jgi:hypothetical protein
LLVLFVILAYAPVSFFLHPLKFGALAYHFPWRLGIVDMIQQGELPLWYPFQHVGVPIHSDPQSGAWYPIVWLFSLFGEYGLYHFHVEHMLHIVLAALGMQFLSKQLNLSAFSSLLVAISYVLSGVFVDNVLTSWTISMAWMPLILGLWLKLSKERSLQNALFISLSLSMMVLGGYPSFTIVFTYIILGFVLFTLIRLYRNNPSYAIRWLGLNSLILFISLLISSVLLIALYQSFGQFARLQELDLSIAADGSLHPKSFISLIFPFTTVSSVNGYIPYLDTYFTMANSYFGLFNLLLLIFSLVIIRRKKLLLFWSLFIFFVLYSMGIYTPLFQGLFHLVPGFDLFRYANFARAFFIPLGLILAGISLDYVWQNNLVQQGKKVLVFPLIVLFGVASYVLIFKDITINSSSLYEYLRDLDFFQEIFIQSLLFMILLLGAIFLLSFRNPKMLKKTLFFLFVFELLISFHLNYIYTAYAPRISLYEAQQLISEKRADYSLNSNQNVFNNWQKDSVYYFDYGFTDYEKRVSYFGNLSFKTKNFSKLLYDHFEVFKRVLSNPLIYFSTEIYTNNSIDSLHLPYSHKALFLDDETFSNMQSNIQQQANGAHISKVSLQNHSYTFEIHNTAPGFVTLLQNYYPGWKAKVNGVITPIHKTNYTFMSVFLPIGKHQVKFYYTNPNVKAGFWISSISFILILLTALILRWINK